MSRRIILTLSTAGCLCGVYALYAMFVSPLFSPEYLEGPQSQSAAANIAPPPPENRRQAERHLAAQPWAADAKYQLRTDEAFVYAEEWERVEPTGDVRFKPFAMIWKRAGQPLDKDPIVIVSESALLKFVSAPAW